MSEKLEEEDDKKMAEDGPILTRLKTELLSMPREKKEGEAAPGENLVVEIKFVHHGKVYPYRALGERLQVGEWVIVEADKEENYGMVAISDHEPFDRKKSISTLPRVLRKVTPEDRERIEKNEKLEREGSEVCLQKIEDRGLPMKLCRVGFSFDGSRATFYFTAEGRVDFRELVRDLAHHFKTKIEMKQMGVRDEARIIGGCGPCGQKLCCAAFLKDFEPVSIKMAKDQSLSLNPVKISGVCGRLMCCLVYEHETYKELREIMPPCGACVKTQTGIGKIDRVHLLQEKVTVVYPDDSKREVLPITEITIVEEEKKPEPSSPPPAPGPNESEKNEPRRTRRPPRKQEKGEE